MWSAVLLVILAAAPEPQVQGSSHQASTDNFEITSAGNPDARNVGRLCEAWRSHLRTTWCPKPDELTWRSKCVVVVHGTRNSYAAAVGRGASGD